MSPDFLPFAEARLADERKSCFLFSDQMPDPRRHSVDVARRAMLDSRGLRADCERRKRGFFPLSQGMLKAGGDSRLRLAALQYILCVISEPSVRGELWRSLFEGSGMEARKRSEQPSRSFLRLGNCQTSRNLIHSCGRDRKQFQPRLHRTAPFRRWRSCSFCPRNVKRPRIPSDVQTKQELKKFGSALCTISLKRQICMR